MTYDHFYCERCKKRHVPPETCPGEELSIKAQLTAAQDRVKELEEALRPFALEYERLKLIGPEPKLIKIDDLRRAAEVLEGK